MLYVFKEVAINPALAAYCNYSNVNVVFQVSCVAELEAISRGAGWCRRQFYAMQDCAVGNITRRRMVQEAISRGTGWCRGQYHAVQDCAGDNVTRCGIVQETISRGAGWCRWQYHAVQDGAGGNITGFRMVQEAISRGAGWCRRQYHTVQDGAGGNIMRCIMVQEAISGLLRRRELRRLSLPLSTSLASTDAIVVFTKQFQANRDRRRETRRVK